MEVGRWNGERFEDQDHGFRAGDFVWRRGRRPTDPWWPGQVFDPRDASEIALMYYSAYPYPKGSLLVVFLDDRSCAWCLPSELVPFFDNLDKMRSGTCVRFVKAVQKVVDEMGRIMESKIMCRCIPLERRGHLARPVVVNVGVKAGVLAPEVDVARLSIPEYGASEILANVLSFAKTLRFDSLFEIAMLRSWISAYSYARHGGHLCVYSEPICIEGLEDRDDDGDKQIVVYDPDPSHGLDDDDPSSPTSDYQRRKKKRVAEKVYQRSKKKRVAEKVYQRRKKKSVGKQGSSQDDLVLDARAISCKLGTLSELLERCDSPVEGLRDDMKWLMEDIETACEKVMRSIASS